MTAAMTLEEWKKIATKTKYNDYMMMKHTFMALALMTTGAAAETYTCLSDTKYSKAEHNFTVSGKRITAHTIQEDGQSVRNQNVSKTKWQHDGKGGFTHSMFGDMGLVCSKGKTSGRTYEAKKTYPAVINLQAAETKCKKILKSKLQNPSTYRARWGSTKTRHIEDNGRVVVLHGFKGKNAFGVKSSFNGRCLFISANNVETTITEAE